VSVPAARLEGWLSRFTASHGDVSWPAADRLVAADGTDVSFSVAFAPLRGSVLEHVSRSRAVGVLLVRRGGGAIAEVVCDGGGVHLVTSKMTRRQVQGRSAAGGWSQQRFARRREGQAREAYGAVADTVATLLLPRAGALDALVTGGDRASVQAVLADPRLAPLRRLVEPVLLDVPDPRQKVLEDALPLVGAVRVEIRDPG
jgi:hypothetical protein